MWPEIPINTLPKALAVLTSMITPALLISACGTFILSTSNRLGRVIDRVSVLSEKLEELMQRDEPVELFEQRRSMIFEQMNRLSIRADQLQRSLTVFYIASGVFVATSVAIGMASLFRTEFNWIPVVLGILGACLLFYGSVILILEARLAVKTLRLEMAFVSTLVKFHTEKKLEVCNQNHWAACPANPGRAYGPLSPLTRHAVRWQHNRRAAYASPKLRQ